MTRDEPNTVSREREQPGDGHCFPTYRIAGLADAVFAIAMTIMVLGLDLAETTEDALLQQFPDIFECEVHRLYNYFVSFLLLAVFWSMHHKHIHHVKRIDHRGLWLNILILMFVALIPFSTSLTGDFPDLAISSIVFACNIGILGVLFFLHWSHATINEDLAKGTLPAAVIRKETRWTIIVILIAVAVLAVSAITPRISLLYFLLIPILFFLKDVR